MRIAEKITILLTVILIALLGYNMLSPKFSDKLMSQQVKLQQVELKKLDSLNQQHKELIKQHYLIIQLLANIDIEVTK